VLGVAICFELVSTYGAALMSRETMSLVTGVAASAEVVAGVRGLIEAEAAKRGAIKPIHTIRTMHLGPQDVLATVRIDFEDSVSAARVEDIVGGLDRGHQSPLLGNPAPVPGGERGLKTSVIGGLATWVSSLPIDWAHQLTSSAGKRIRKPGDGRRR